jgi:hypothetical protein
MECKEVWSERGQASLCASNSPEWLKNSSDPAKQFEASDAR